MTNVVRPLPVRARPATEADGHDFSKGLRHDPLEEVRLRPGAVAVPALASYLRPALLMGEAETLALLEQARLRDVGNDGEFAAGPAGIQVWSGPFNGPSGTRGTAALIGSVDWTYGTPVRHYATIYRAMVTSAGVERGHTPQSILATVADLGGLSIEGQRLTMPAAPARDPFRPTESSRRPLFSG